jgi:hypothetical protein
MSRRHHGGRSHRQNGHARGAAPLASTQASPRHGQPSPGEPAQPPQAPRPPVDAPRLDAPAEAVFEPDHESEPAVPPPVSEGGPEPSLRPMHRADAQASGPAGSGGCTAPQLRRFIKSRPYVPMHELRRRFGINGSEDDVTLVHVDGGSVFVGLPPREGGLLGELLRGGEVGYELSLDPRSPVVVGLYPMRPVPRT